MPEGCKLEPSEDWIGDAILREILFNLKNALKLHYNSAHCVNGLKCNHPTIDRQNCY